MKKVNFYFCCFFSFFVQWVHAQVNWKQDTGFHNLPNGVQLYFTNDTIEGKPNIAYYIAADLKNKNLQFDVDTTSNRRLTPTEFYEKNKQPLLVVNGTFFSFQNNKNLNVVIKNGKLLAFNIPTVQRKGKDNMQRNIPIYRSAIGITKKRHADIAWIKTDTVNGIASALQYPLTDTSFTITPELEIRDKVNSGLKKTKEQHLFQPWKMETAIGGGPVLVQNGVIKITNEFEQMFTGKAIADRHPRTAMGYTANGKLIILVVQGRFPGIAEGVTLHQEAVLLRDIGCVEALNLDGGGSSCMLVNGKETILPSDKTGQRAVPAIFMIKAK